MNDKTKKRQFRVTAKTHSGDTYTFTQGAEDRLALLLNLYNSLQEDAFLLIPDCYPGVILHPTAIAAVEVEATPTTPTPSAPSQGEGVSESPNRT